MREGQILNIFPSRIRERFCQVSRRMEDLQEIRLVAGWPVRVVCLGEEYFLSLSGEMTKIIGESCWRISPGEMDQIRNRQKHEIYPVHDYPDFP